MRTEEASSRLLVRLVARALLACLSMLVLWSVVPLALGWRPSVVMTGSMAPSIKPGDVVVVRHVPDGDVRVHHVVLVPDPDHRGRLRLHRVEEIRPGGRLVLHGDANRDADSSLVRLRDVLGIGVLRVPLVGSPTRAARTGQWAQLGLMIAGVVAVVGFAQGGRQHDGGRPSSFGRRRRTPVPSRWDGGDPRRPLVVRRAAVAAVVTPLVFVAGPGGFASFKITAANTTNNFTSASSYYPYKDAVLADTPVLYWRLGETSGSSAANTATSGPAGTYYSTPTLGQASALTSEIVNKSVSTTTSGFVTAATAVTAPTQYTIEAWIKTTTTAGGRIFGFGNGGTTALSTTVDKQLYLSPTGKVVAGIRNVTLTKTAATSPLSYNNGAWHYVAATYDATTLRLYVDGAQVATTTTTAAVSFSGFWRAGMENLSGWPSAPSGNNYAGGLDELAVYATALSATRILAHYTAAS